MTRLRVAAAVGSRWTGKLLVGTSVIPCSLGPAGTFRLQTMMFRPDRIARPLSRLKGHALRERDGWCDDSGAADYNQPVDLPCAYSHEALWRADALYDMMVVIDHNRRPARKQKGSAIFLHVRASGGAPTAGCVAIEVMALRRVLARIDVRTSITIG